MEEVIPEEGVSEQDAAPVLTDVDPEASQELREAVDSLVSLGKTNEANALLNLANSGDEFRDLQSILDVVAQAMGSEDEVWVSKLADVIKVVEENKEKPVEQIVSELPFVGALSLQTRLLITEFASNVLERGIDTHIMYSTIMALDVNTQDLNLVERVLGAALLLTTGAVITSGKIVVDNHGSRMLAAIFGDLWDVVNPADVLTGVLTIISNYILDIGETKEYDKRVEWFIAAILSSIPNKMYNDFILGVQWLAASATLAIEPVATLVVDIVTLLSSRGDLAVTSAFKTSTTYTAKDGTKWLVINTPFLALAFAKTPVYGPDVRIVSTKIIGGAVGGTILKKIPLAAYAVKHFKMQNNLDALQAAVNTARNGDELLDWLKSKMGKNLTESYDATPSASITPTLDEKIPLSNEPISKVASTTKPNTGNLYSKPLRRDQDAITGIIQRTPYVEVVGRMADISNDQYVEETQ